MPTFPRLEFPGYPYHVIQRGNRSQKVFLRPSDKDCYLAILKLQCQFFNVDVWAYCLMDNHVHLIVMPRQGDGLSECIGETHRQYTRMINFREKWRGYLWQGRFKSFPMDDQYLNTAVRYVELNPVRAALVKNPEDFKYSSARAHITKEPNDILSDFYLTKKIANWKDYLAEDEGGDKLNNIRLHQRTGRPLGGVDFVIELEKKSGLILTKQKPGPRIKDTVCVC